MNAPSVFDHNRVYGEFRTEKNLLLSGNHGLVDSINIEHPNIFKVFSGLKSQDWSFDEFDFSQCMQDFKRCDKSVYDAMITTLAWQWEADSIVSNNMVAITTNFTNSTELMAAVMRANVSEVEHALTYSEIVRSSFEDPNTVIEQMTKIEQSFTRLGVVEDIFNEAFKTSHQLALGIIKTDQQAYNSAFMYFVALYLLERLQFIASFAITFGVAEGTGMFIEIATAVKKIAADEIGNGINSLNPGHAGLDMLVLENELKTTKGKLAFDQCKDKIKQAIDSVVEQEINWSKFIFSDNKSLVGLNETLLTRWVHFNAADVYDFFGFDLPFERVTENPLPWILSYLPGANSAIQYSPQEQNSDSYLLGGVVSDVKGSIDFEL